MLQDSFKIQNGNLLFNGRYVDTDGNELTGIKIGIVISCEDFTSSHIRNDQNELNELIKDVILVSGVNSFDIKTVNLNFNL